MWVPDTFASCARLSLQVLLAKILFCRLALEFLQLRPAILEQLGGEIGAVEVRGTNVARNVIARRQRVCGRKCDRFADNQSTEKFA